MLAAKAAAKTTLAAKAAAFLDKDDQPHPVEPPEEWTPNRQNEAYEPRAFEAIREFAEGELTAWTHEMTLKLRQMDPQPASRRATAFIETLAAATDAADTAKVMTLAAGMECLWTTFQDAGDADELLTAEARASIAVKASLRAHESALKTTTMALSTALATTTITWMVNPSGAGRTESSLESAISLLNEMALKLSERTNRIRENTQEWCG